MKVFTKFKCESQYACRCKYTNGVIAYKQGSVCPKCGHKVKEVK